MQIKNLALIGQSLKENEKRVPVHPEHLFVLPVELRQKIFLDKGYGQNFGLEDSVFQLAGFRVFERDELLKRSKFVILPKPTVADLSLMQNGAFLWGWPHCVQQKEMTQVAIDKRLTLIAWESMFSSGSNAAEGFHLFYRNNEMAGYAAVKHALQLAGMDGGYGPHRRAAILSFGSCSRGAIAALQGSGFRDINVFTRRSPHLVRDKILGCEYFQMFENEGRIFFDKGSAIEPLMNFLGTSDLIVNGILQDATEPFNYFKSEETVLLKTRCLIVDVSCDEGMGFPFARPLSFNDPLLQIQHFLYYGVDHTPSLFWDSASWEISQVVIGYLAALLADFSLWLALPEISQSIEIVNGEILNPQIAIYQKRYPSFPHAFYTEKRILPRPNKTNANTRHDRRTKISSILQAG